MDKHEWEEKKIPKNSKCGDCHTKLTGLISAKGHQCRNCLAILCKKCASNPRNASGCGTGMGGGAQSQQASAMPSDPVMEFYIKYVKRNANGEMVVRGLPPEWKQLFKDAGVKPKELQDPKTASWLIGLMNDILSGTVGAVDGAAGGAAAAAAVDDEAPVLRVEALYDFDAVQDGDLNFRKGDIIIVKNVLDNGWAEGESSGKFGQFPYNYVKELPPEPKAPPPAPIPARPTPSAPTAPAPAAPTPVAAVAPAAVVVAAPPPPPPPPAAGPKPPPAPGAPPPPAAKPPAPAPVAAKPASFLDDIASGAKPLRKVADTPAPVQKKELSQLTANERSNMLDIISAAMNARRKDIDDNEGDDGGDWDDWEDD